MQSRPRIIGDFETRSEADLRDMGAWKYSEHPSTRILCMSYKIAEGPTKIWRAFHGDPFPQDFIDAIEAGGVFEAHGAGFERAIWTSILEPQFLVPMPKYWADTMACCAYRSLPMDLEDVGSVLNLKTQKDKRGKELLRLLSRPQKISKKEEKAGVKFPKWNNDLALMEELYQYCITDTDTEYELAKAVKDLPLYEHDVWTLDQQINERGVYVDVDALLKAVTIRDAVYKKLLAKLVTITGGAVHSADERQKIIDWVDAQNLRISVDYDTRFCMDDMTKDRVKDAVEKLSGFIKAPGHLEENVPKAKAVLEVMQIRQTLGKTSTKKLDTFLEWCMLDGRLRGLLQYHGASTGRWAGRGVQPQNFPRPSEALMILMDSSQVFEGGKKIKLKHDGMDNLLELVRGADADILELLCGDPMDAMASALRGFIIAEPGKELFVSDFSAIEARVLAWVAGERWKLDAFQAIDEGKGYHGSQDIYLATASMVYGYPCLTKKTHGPERQVGKVCELAFGYQGGVGAWRKFDPSDKWTDEEVDSKKRGWRSTHPMTVKLWYGLEEAAVKAVRNKATYHYRDITYAYVTSPVGPWLACRLPNGRCLWYFRPEAVETGIDRRTGEMKYQVEYEGKDNKHGGQWNRIRTYGGMLTENVVQAISRDLMVEAMFRVERAGYPIILTVHDEIICERRIGLGTMKEFNELMSMKPEWVTRNPMPLPISVAGYVAIRYRKD